ncbi:hypothetical protein GOODEAATRI_020875, partial [Goodea atripinnis]
FGFWCLPGKCGGPVSAAIKTALGRLQLDVPLAQPAPSSAFFRRRDAEAAFVVPPSVVYVQELHACWTNTRGFSHPTAWLTTYSLLMYPSQNLINMVPGELFGSAALEALERTAQASRTRQQLAGLHRPPRRPVAAGAAGGSFRSSLPPPVSFLGSTSTAPRPRPTRAQGDHGGAQSLRPVQSAHSGRCFPRPSRGQGACW